jgi:ubiquinone/menaquinone biosynthesis C-methylase UbiE
VSALGAEFMPPEPYHLRELTIARDPNDPRHVTPPAFPPDRRVLDVGCGAGQTLIACYGDRRPFGVDVDVEALRLGRSLTDRVAFIGAAAEHLPFRDSSFDVVTARVSLPYTDLRLSLPEIRRVLKPGGFFWAVLHPLVIPWTNVDPRRPRTLLFFGYVVLNSLLFHFTGRMMSCLGRRYESFQTASGMRRALRAAGFGRLTASRRPHFVVTAEATARSHPRSGPSPDAPPEAGRTIRTL